ncbi:MAG: hypothetical protein HRT65_01225 [Flavobacteriaceae bacterium]|uniref:hypothetical protein n=1 Tax=Flagellimonas algarum TaxID=3230298 RepID=UPI00339A6FCE|nr:hypothetical protein [Flavobacteriaceae bacterium]
MKSIKNYVMMAVGILVVSCSSDDKLIDTVDDSVERGLVLRTVNTISSSYNIFDTTSEWGVTLEVQDAEGGTLLSEVRVFVAFNDQSTLGGDQSTAETAIATLDPATFTTGPFGLPRTDLTVSFSDALAATGIAFADIEGGDQFNFRLEAELTDGRVFTNNANGTVLGGSFFSSPFAYVSTVVCPPTVPTAGDWTIDFQDSFGDGWNDAALVVTIDGEATSYTLDDGSAGSVTFNVPDGAQEISIVFTSGAFDEEVSAQVTSANGNVVVDISPNPTADAELLDYCLNNL